MAVYNPFYVPAAPQSPYLANLAGVGGAYNQLVGGATAPLTDASGNFINAGQNEIGPGEFDPTVASLLATSRNPVNNEIEDYFYNKYMADANNRVANRGLIGQGAGEGLLNQAAKDYSFGRADTGLGRQIAAGNAASGIRTGQVGRAASLMGAGLSPYDTLNNLLRGQGNVYGTAGELNNQVGISNARNQAYGNINAFNRVGAPLIGSLARGGYDALFGPMSDSQIAAVRDQGLTSDTTDTSVGGGGGGRDSGDTTDVFGGFFDAKGGRVPGRGAYDHVRAILTPKEFVVRRPVAEQARPALERLNAGDFSGAARRLARTASVAR